MPDYLVAEELAAGKLLSLNNQHFRGGIAQLVAARKAGKPHGPVASKLWDALRKQTRQRKPKR